MNQNDIKLCNDVAERVAWERMSLELRIVRIILENFCGDEEYSCMLAKKQFNGVVKLIKRVDQVRSELEDRMANKLKTWSTQTFFPGNNEYDYVMASQIRKQINECAIETAKEMAKSGKYGKDDSIVKRLVLEDSYEQTCQNCAFCGPGSLCLAPWTDLTMEENDIDPCYEGVYYRIVGEPNKHLKQLFDKGVYVYLWKEEEE